MVESAATNPIADVAATSQDVEKTELPVVGSEPAIVEKVDATLNPVPTNDAKKSEVDASTEAEATADGSAELNEKKEKIREFFTAGKRDYISGQLETASDKLGEAAALSVEVYGQFAAECYDVHVYYAKTLLEIGRSEDDVIKTAMTDLPIPEEVNESMDEEQYGNPDTLTDAERDEIKDKVDDALTENAAELDAQCAGSPEKVSVDAEEKMDNESTPEESTATPTEGSESEVAVTAESSEVPTEAMENENGDEINADVEDGESQEEEATSFQAAWEVLEVARNICDKAKKESEDEIKEWQTKKIQVLLLLGECSIEDENYKQAIEDLTEAYELCEKFLGVCRMLADTFYTIARAYKLYEDFDQALVFYRKTKETFEKLIGEIGEKSSETDDEKAADSENLALYQSFLPDLDVFIDDACESAKQLEEKRKQVMEAKDAIVNALVSMTDAPASDISNLVRKPVKRAAEVEASDDSEQSVKRAKSAEPSSESTAAVETTD